MATLSTAQQGEMVFEKVAGRGEPAVVEGPADVSRGFALSSESVRMVEPDNQIYLLLGFHGPQLETGSSVLLEDDATGNY
jgi:hypothetical protein